MSKENILVVEDGDPIRNLLQTRLAKDGFQVKGAGKVSDALHEIRTSMPDIIILDLTLEEDNPFAGLTDGFSFLSMLRRNHPEADPSVIIFSASPSPEVEARAKSLGVRTIIGKKAGVRALLDAINAALEERKSKEATPPVVLLPEPTREPQGF